MFLFGDVSQPFLASLAAGGLLGIIGLVRVGWTIGPQISRGKLVTHVTNSKSIITKGNDNMIAATGDRLRVCLNYTLHNSGADLDL
jgi:hypothetical protein